MVKQEPEVAEEPVKLADGDDAKPFPSGVDKKSF